MPGLYEITKLLIDENSRLYFQFDTSNEKCQISSFGGRPILQKVGLGRSVRYINFGFFAITGCLNPI